MVLKAVEKVHEDVARLSVGDRMETDTNPKCHDANSTVAANTVTIAAISLNGENQEINIADATGGMTSTATPIDASSNLKVDHDIAAVDLNTAGGRQQNRRKQLNSCLDRRGATTRRMSWRPSGKRSRRCWQPPAGVYT